MELALIITKERHEELRKLATAKKLNYSDLVRKELREVK